MGSNELSTPMSDSSEQALEDAKEFQANSCSEQSCSAEMVTQKLSDFSGLVMDIQECAGQPSSEQQCCPEMDDMVPDILTRDIAAIGLSSTSSQVSNAMCLSTEDECVAEASPGSTFDALQGVAEISCLPELKKVSDTEYGVSGLCLKEKVAHDLDPKMCALNNALSSGDQNIYTGDGLVHLNEPLFSSAAGELLMKGELHPPLSCLSNSSERNVGTEGDLSNVFEGLLQPSPLSPRYELLTGSTELDETRNDENVEGSVIENHLGSGELQHEALNDQPVATNGVSSVVETLEKGGPHPLDSVHVAGSSVKSTIDLQSSPDIVAVDHETFKKPVSLGEIKLDDLLEVVDSINVDNVSPEVSGGKGNDEAGNIISVELTGTPSVLRRSSRTNKYIPKVEIRRNIKKGKKSSMLVSEETYSFLRPAVRSKRSCSSRVARASSWGLMDAVSRHVVHTTGAVDQIPKLVKIGGGTKKKNKVQASSSSPVLKGKNHAISGPIRLKVKLGNEATRNIKQVIPSAKTDSIAVDFVRNSVNQLDGMKHTKNSAMCQESNVDILNPERSLQSTMSGANPSDKDVEKSGSSADDRYLNSGTSPDSEVINQVPDSQFASSAIKVCEKVGMDLPKDNIGSLTDANSGKPTMRKKKGSKKDRALQPGDLDIQDRAPFMLNIKSETNKVNTIGTMMDGGIDSAEYKKIKSSKGKGKHKNKSTCTVKSDVVNSHKVKGDKWTLINKHPITEYGMSDQVNIVRGTTEAGNCARTDTSCGETKDVSNQPVAPYGVGQPIGRPRSAWVCCDDCHKWRCIPAVLADVIGDTNCRWTCKDNQDKGFSDCSIPQEKSNAEINAELDISDEEDGRDARLGGNYDSMKHKTAFPQQASWTLIKSNIFLHRSRKKQTADEIMVCHCNAARDGKYGCGDECLNRMLSIECVQGSCPCGDLCSNQQFQKRKYAKLNWFRCGKKGYGLQSLEDIAEGKFLIEYVGEVLDLQSYEARQRRYASKGHKHFYFMTLNGNEVIDACAKGNMGRFINHSCEPNCRTEKWIVNGEICIGLFAMRDIKKGEEVTFDYNYVRVFGAAAKKCHCGSAHCRGYIGGDPLNTDVIVQDDSDEEFPEPVVIYENDEISGSGEDVCTTSGTQSAAGENSKEVVLQHSAGILSNDQDAENRVMDLAIVGADTAEDSAIDTVVGHPSGKSEDLSLEAVSVRKSDISAVDKLILDSLAVSADPEAQKSQADIAKGRVLLPKSRPRMKVSRPYKSVKSRNSGNCGVALDSDAITIHNKSQVMDNKPKKVTDRSTNNDLETVDAKLSELLDSEGGICKRKDASRGYLKLLVLTSASGDGSDRATIQSARDLSMILDAILKTKSRTVLTDIINKNGLQMLHMMMKKCKGNFNKIPILRKLLKVFEFLVEKEIITLEHINEGPSRVGVESFRNSILNLTEHEDKKVHQIARNFRDKWIPRPLRKYNCMDWSDRLGEYSRGLNSSRSLGSHHRWPDQIERAPEPLVEDPKTLPVSNSIDNAMVEGSTHPTSCTTSLSGIRKRKSRWDQPAEHNPKQIKTEMQDSMDEEDDDAPPGFSRPSLGAPLFTIAPSTKSSISQQYPGPLKCPSEAPSAYPPERYNSKLPVSYGIPLNVVQEFGTPQSVTGEGWVIAPGMVFHPFPPVPLHLRKQGITEAPVSVDGADTSLMDGNGGNIQQQDSLPGGSNHHYVDQGFPSTPSGGWTGNANLDRSNFGQQERHSHSQGRRNPYSH